MNDLRLPLGLLLAFYGVILVAHGAIERVIVAGINVNLWWGAVLVGFGGAMLYLARRNRHQSSVVRHQSSEVSLKTDV